ncbi:polyphosphate kinase 2 [Winogradskyella undariae]|uniref:polyphosphate kinase 2 n=1 Tax=Winogradskyella TaxID=286104 RepID=UPI00156B9499|nr:MULTISPECIES: polyphosphate kinase 2 [Winogradskyella]NRR92356.1 polyphosphate kinase 2 [Winogradskyella undariae]QNK78591.1 polyphosphate kinase 2 [Winogradskyella sp. PAMC22761]QXP78384.1 polyphosphate kinase 2 [Winogradskyella sp. HaHa_3_26]
MLTEEILNTFKKKADLVDYIEKHQDDNPTFKIALEKYAYEQELLPLQAELVDFQHWVQKEKKKIAIIFEGRDASGKGGTIKRFTEHLNPRARRIVALNKPTEIEKSQWYFNRYIKELPNAGEIVFFDRSWYNRAVVEPVMGFCSKEQYNRFMIQVPEFEHMLYENGTIIIKFWFSVSKEEQQRRFEKRLKSPLKKWKFSPVDEKGQELWNEFTTYKNQMFSRTHNSFSPWVVIKSNDKKRARLESIKYVLSMFDYDNKGSNCKSLLPDPNIVQRYFRNTDQLDQ